MPEPLLEALERVALATVGLTARALSETPSGVELTLPQWRVLVIVGERPEGSRIGEIAGRLGSGLPAAGRLVRRLERRGLVATRTDPTDRRATLVRLGPDGEALRASILEHRRSGLRAAVDRVPGQDRDQLARDLAVLVEALEAGT
jgi:DNA-binding MarR family transcriptional regulator